jgi:hypothetical protein
MTQGSSSQMMNSQTTPLSAAAFGSGDGKPGMEVRPLLSKQDSMIMEARE